MKWKPHYQKNLSTLGGILKCDRIGSIFRVTSTSERLSNRRV